MRIAVCDDVREMRNYLKAEIGKKLLEQKIRHDIYLFEGGRDFLAEHRKKPFDVVFLDIIMPEMNGFEVAKRIREISEKTYIIFVTTENSLVYDSFDFQPFHFIPKCSRELTSKRLSHVINKLIIHSAASEKIEIPAAYGEKYFAFPNEIIYIRSNAKNIEYYFTERPVLRVRGKLDEAEERLGRYMFVRIHNRYIINMSFIRDADYPNSEVRLKNGIVLDISRTYKKSFSEAYNTYMKNF